MKSLIFSLALTAIFLSSAHADQTQKCRDLQNAVKAWDAANSVFDALSDLTTGTDGTDQRRIEMLQWAAMATSEARNIADQAAGAVFFSNETNDRQQTLQTVTLSHALSAREAYREVADEAVKNGGPLLVKTLDASRPLTSAYYALVLAVRCR